MAGFLILLDYMANYPTPPLISTLKPTPINLKDIWNSHKAENKNHVAELEAAEMRAQALANDLADLELHDDNNNNVANSKVHADEQDEAEILIEMQEVLKGMKLPADEQRKAKIAAKQKKLLRSFVCTIYHHGCCKHEGCRKVHAGAQTSERSCTPCGAKL